jgi:hypothetical protein
MFRQAEGIYCPTQELPQELPQDLLEPGIKHMHMDKPSETHDPSQAHRRPLFGSVWLALFVMLRGGLNQPRTPLADAGLAGDDLSRGDDPSRRQ